MYLLIDLSKTDTIHLALFTEAAYVETVVTVSNRALLPTLASFLETHHQSKQDVAGIMVVIGAGGFTSTRLSVTCANTFAYAYGIPLLAIDEADISQVQSRIPRLREQPRGQYLSATYSAEPTIGRAAAPVC